MSSFLGWYLDDCPGNDGPSRRLMRAAESDNASAVVMNMEGDETAVLHGDSPVHTAIAYHNTHALTAILCLASVKNTLARVFATIKDGRTPLASAVRSDNLATVCLLVAHKHPWDQSITPDDVDDPSIAKLLRLAYPQFKALESDR